MVPFVFRVYTYGCIRHDGFRTGRCDDDVFVGRIAIAVRYEISQMIELAYGIPVDDLFVAHCRKSDRIPVYHADTSIDISFLVKVHERVDDSFTQVGIHSEFRPVPVAGGAQLA